jgi:hypothetical protein
MPKLSPRVLHRRFLGETGSVWIRTLHTSVDLLDGKLDDENWSGRRVLGYRIPVWQRPEVWTDDQCSSFIESIYLGANIGAFMYNSYMGQPSIDHVILDGQQRLRSLERYWNNEIPAHGEDGKPYLWSDLTEDEQAHLYRINFPYIMTSYDDEALLKQVYNVHNFSGTPHKITDRLEGAAPLTTTMKGLHGQRI